MRVKLRVELRVKLRVKLRDISDQTGGRGEAGRVRVRRGKLAGGEERERERTNTRLSCSARYGNILGGNISYQGKIFHIGGKYLISGEHISF